MARRLILDTGVVINAERAQSALGSVVDADDDVAIAAVTAAELYAGIELADERHRTQRAEFVARVLDVIPVEPYDLSIAEAHGRLLAHVHRSGDAKDGPDDEPFCKVRRSARGGLRCAVARPLPR